MQTVRLQWIRNHTNAAFTSAVHTQYIMYNSTYIINICHIKVSVQSVVARKKRDRRRLELFRGPADRALLPGGDCGIFSRALAVVVDVVSWRERKTMTERKRIERNTPRVCVRVQNIPKIKNTKFPRPVHLRRYFRTTHYIIPISYN